MYNLDTIQDHDADVEDGMTPIDIFTEDDVVVLNPESGESISIHRRNIQSLILQLQLAEANMREQDLADKDDVPFSEDVEIEAEFNT